MMASSPYNCMERVTMLLIRSFCAGTLACLKPDSLSCSSEISLWSRDDRAWAFVLFSSDEASDNHFSLWNNTLQCTYIPVYIHYGVRTESEWMSEWKLSREAERWWRDKEVYHTNLIIECVELDWQLKELGKVIQTGFKRSQLLCYFIDLLCIVSSGYGNLFTSPLQAQIYRLIY